MAAALAFLFLLFLALTWLAKSAHPLGRHLKMTELPAALLAGLAGPRPRRRLARILERRRQDAALLPQAAAGLAAVWGAACRLHAGLHLPATAAPAYADARYRAAAMPTELVDAAAYAELTGLMRAAAAAPGEVTSARAAEARWERPGAVEPAAPGQLGSDSQDIG